MQGGDFEKISIFASLYRGSSSVGRASASQAEGRGFESRFPLLIISHLQTFL
jgi:hypothetical protein